jgi:hypothetical protein
MSDHKLYDIIIVGTGPISIIEACFQKKKGKSVLLIEEGSKASGAWSTYTYNGLPEIEIGCHIWDITPKAYDFLAAFFDLELVKLSPQPRILKKGRRLPYDWKRNAFGVKQILKRSAQMKFRLLWNELKLPQNKISFLPEKYLYPINGAKDLKNAIESKIKSFELDISFNEKVNQIECGEVVKINSSKGTRIAKKIITTSLSQVEAFRFNQKTIEPSSRKVDYIHCHLLLSKPPKTQLSYDRVMDSDLIHRISDMTFQVQGEIETGQHLICCGVFAKEFHKHSIDDIPDLCMNELKKLAYLNNDHEVIESGVNVFPSYYNDGKALHEIEKYGSNKIKILRSTNFTYSINSNADRWSELLLSGCNK